MRKPNVFTTIVVSVVGLIIIPFSTFIVQPTVMAAQQQSNSSSQNTTLGSGFVYDKQGYIVTNGHVVGDAKIVDVTFVDGNRYTAKVVAL